MNTGRQIVFAKSAVTGDLSNGFRVTSSNLISAPVATGDLSNGIRIATTSSDGGLPQGVILATEQLTSGDPIDEKANRKTEIRLTKNREAARECRAKKKEYVKCLENRVTVLEKQNKALIEELKTLKALYCKSS